MINHPYFLLALATLLWAGNGIAGKLAAGEIAPMTLVLLRWSVAVLVLLPFSLAAVKKDWATIKANALLLSAYGVFGFATFNLLFYQALNYTTALNSSLIQAVVPMVILLTNLLIFRQPLSRAQLLGLFLALIGVVLIVTAGNPSALLTLSINRGDVLLLINCVIYALYSVGLRKKPDISWYSFIFVLASVACLTSLPFAVYEMLTTEKVFNSSLKSYLLVGYVAIFVSIISQIAYAKGIGMIGANRGSFAINLVPVFGAMMAVVFLGEAFRWYHLLGLILVMSGIALSERFARKAIP